MESNLEDDFVAKLEARGCIVVKQVPTRKGWPDRLVLWPGGRVDLVELKTDTGKLETLQAVWLTRIAARGGNAHVLYGRQGLSTYLSSPESPGEVRVWPEGHRSHPLLSPGR